MEQTQLINDIHDRIVQYLKDQDKNIGLTKPKISPEHLYKEFDISLDESTNFDGIKEIIEKYLTLAVKTGSTNFYNQLFSGCKMFENHAKSECISFTMVCVINFLEKWNSVSSQM